MNNGYMPNERPIASNASLMLAYVFSPRPSTNNK